MQISLALDLFPNIFHGREQIGGSFLVLLLGYYWCFKCFGFAYYYAMWAKAAPSSDPPTDEAKFNLLT